MSTLVLLRHGESEWNRENRFTGWVDSDLSDTGEREARAAGRMLVDAGLRFDVLHTSLQRRAIRTANLALEVADQLWVPVRRSWRLNERHYGALQGQNKKEATAQFGEDQVFQWRRSYDVPPPPLSIDDPGHPRHDPRYAGVAPDALPAGECLADVVVRMLPYWYDAIAPDLADGKDVLVAAHGNSLRALAKHLLGITDHDIAELNIPTGIPWRFELDAVFQPVGEPTYLDPELAGRKAAEVARQATG